MVAARAAVAAARLALRMSGWLVLAAWLLVHLSPASADVDESAYAPGGVVRDETQRRRLQEQFRVEAEDERRRLDALAAALARQRAEAAAREAARPYPERLTGQRCTRCHAATNFLGQRHTRLGWQLVVTRMVWLNEAAIPLDEQLLIAGYLAGALPATADEYRLEYGLPLLVLGLSAAAVRGGRRWWRQHRRPTEEVRDAD